MEFTYLEFGMILGLMAISYWLGGLRETQKFEKKFTERKMR